jgi:hypothetical protein
MLILQDTIILGHTGDSDPYLSLLPWSHESSAAWWILDPSGFEFTDSDGTIYHLHKRTLVELQATPEYQAWISANPSALPKLYVTLTISGGDGGNPPGINLSDQAQNSLTLTGHIRIDPSNPATTLPISKSWRFTICKVRSELRPDVIDSTVKTATLTNGAISMTLMLDTPGVYMLSANDFDLIRAADFPQFGLTSDYQVLLVGGDHFFKVY